MGSSASASSVVGLVAGAVKNLVIDMAVVLQVRRPPAIIPRNSFHHSGSQLISCLLLVTEAHNFGLDTPFKRHCGGAQANSVECLPESLLGTMRLNHLDLSAGALQKSLSPHLDGHAHILSVFTKSSSRT